MKRDYFDGPYGQVHYRALGDGPPVMLLHQSPLSSAQFLSVAPLLARAGFRVFALDLPGMGMSDAAPSSADLDDFAAIVPAAVAALGLERTHLVGHHTGAAIGARLAARQPNWLDRLVLNGVPLLSAEERAFFAGFAFGPPALSPDGAHLAHAWGQRLKASPGWTNLAAMHRYVVEGLARGETSWMAFPAILGADLTADLAAIQAPTLLLTNTGEDLYAATVRAQALRPDWPFIALEGGTHDIMDEQPENWARAVIDFLRAPRRRDS